MVTDKDSDGLSWVKCSFSTDYLVDGMWTSPDSLPVSVGVGSKVEREKASRSIASLGHVQWRTVSQIGTGTPFIDMLKMRKCS